MHLLEGENVCKNFGGLAAVAEVDFTRTAAWRETVAPYLADRTVFSWKGKC